MIGSRVSRALAAVFQEQLKTQAAGDPRNYLKKFISEGLLGGSIGIEPSYKMNDVQTLNGILKLCHQEGLRDVRFLSKVQEKFSVISCDTPRDWYCFLSQYNKLGYIDPVLTMHVLAELAGSGFADMSPKHCGSLLEIMDRQGVFLPELSLHIAGSCWDHPELVSSSSVFRALVNLDVDNGETLQKISQQLEPQSLQDWTNCAYAVALSPTLMSQNQTVEKLLIGALEHMSSHQSLWTEYLKTNPQRSRDIQIIRHALVYAYPDAYSSTTEKMKQALAMTGTLSVSPLNARRSRPPAVVFVESLSKSLLSLRVAHEKNSTLGPFAVDIIERDARLIWQCQGPNRYFSGTGAWRRLRPYHALQERVLSGMGYAVVLAPHWQWANMRSTKTRSDYCRTNRFLALNDPRQTHTGIGTHRHDDPASYDAREDASTIMDVYRNQGETFFKKGAPKRHWEWNRDLSDVTPLRVSI